MRYANSKRESERTPPGYSQIKISVIDRKSRKTISILAWLVLEGEKLFLLPVRGSDTQWFKNLLQNSSIRLMREAWERNSEPFPSLMPRW